MSLSEHVTITIQADSLGVPKAGFGIPMILSVNATFPERIRFYTDLAGVAADFAVTTSPEYLAAKAMFSQSPHPETIAIGKALGKPTQKYRLDVSTVGEGLTYGLTCTGQGATANTFTYTTLADLTFVDGDITVGTDLIAELSHGMTTGAGPFRVSNAGGALPAGLVVDTNYWIIATTLDSFKLATSKANALAGTAVDITAAAGGGTHTLRRNQNDVICAQLVQGINATVGKNFTAVQQVGAGETDYVEVTGNAAGNWFSLEVNNVALLKIAQDHAEPATSLATDLTAINNENNTWYAAYTLYNSEAYVKATAAAIEPLKKMYFADLSMSETVTLAAAGTGTSDPADDLKVLAWDRTATVYHPSPASMLGAAWMGTRLSYDPGSETWKFATPAGQTPPTFTATHKVNLRAKNCNTIETIGGRGVMWEGKVLSGEFIDIIRGLDWLENDIQTEVYNALVSAGLQGKIAMTDPGIAVIESEIYGSLGRAINVGLLAADPKPIVVVPKVADVATVDKQSRTLRGVKFSGTLAGAIHKLFINGVVSA